MCRPRFNISSSTGAITTKKVLDREKQDFYQITVIAQDGGGQRDSTQLSVTLRDINDNTPVFSSTVYQTSLDEGSLTLNLPVSVHVILFQ